MDGVRGKVGAEDRIGKGTCRRVRGTGKEGRERWGKKGEWVGRRDLGVKRRNLKDT